jgi:hypothetical protein
MAEYGQGVVRLRIISGTLSYFRPARLLGLRDGEGADTTVRDKVSERALGLMARRIAN